MKGYAVIEKMGLKECKTELEDRQLNHDRHAIGHKRRARAQVRHDLLLKRFKELGGNVATLGGHYW